MLAPHVKSLTAVDSSTGMIKMLENKLEAQEEIKNVRAVAALIEDPDDRILQGPEPGDKPKRFDLIVRLSRLARFAINKGTDNRKRLATSLSTISHPCSRSSNCCSSCWRREAT